MQIALFTAAPGDTAGVDDLNRFLPGHRVLTLDRAWTGVAWSFCATVRDVCRRFGGDPQRVVLAAFLAASGVTGDFTFVDLPYPNHSARWVLCDQPARQRAREWLQRVARVGGTIVTGTPLGLD